MSEQDYKVNIDVLKLKVTRNKTFVSSMSSVV